MISIALPLDKGVGHALCVIGYDPATNQFQFFDPAYGDKIDETKFKSRYGSFDQVWQNNSNFIIPKASMVTLKPRELPSLPTPGGGGLGNELGCHKD